MLHRRSAIALAATAAFTHASVHAQAQDAEPPSLETVTVTGFRGTQMANEKYSRELKDTPRLITILPAALLEVQGAATLKDTLKNIPGISLQVGEGNPPSGDQFKIRGFNARDDINVNGARDLGNYFRDPFYVDQVEVVKGPNSAYSGRGSAGGSINFVTKQPRREAFTRVELTPGTDSHLRGTLDLNRPLSDDSALRVNLMGHRADIPGRDIAQEERYGAYAAYTWGFKGPTRLSADLLLLKVDDLPDAGLPTDRLGTLGTLDGIETGMAPGLKFSNFYGHGNDRKQVDVSQLGVALRHAFDSGVVLKNQLRLSRVHNEGWVSSPRTSVGDISGQPNDGVTTACSVAAPCARGETKPRDQFDTGIDNQTDLLVKLKTGGVEHDLVVGLALARNSYSNDRLRDTRGPWTSLASPLPRTLGPNTVIGGTLYGLPVPDGTNYRLRTEEVGVYLLDTMRLSERWDLSAGLRRDQVKATATRSGFNGVNGAVTNNTSHEREDSGTSYNLGLVYKLDARTSLYAAVGNAYVFSANFDRNSVQLAGGGATEAIVGAGFNTPPEKMRAYELGAKLRVATGLDLGAALFRTEVTNGRLPGQGNGVTGLPNNEYHIDGLELLAAGRITPAWQLYAGYTYLDNRITNAADAGANRAYVESQKLGNTPRHSLNVFTVYDLDERISLGGGLQHVGSVTSGVDPVAGDANYKVRIPGYTVVDLYAAYRFNRQTQLRMNLNNAADKRYIAQLAEGGAQGIPGKARQLLLTLRHDF
ncbi:MAG: TonB-dependent siderophore receptor PiuA [Rubrivivax sp.]